MSHSTLHNLVLATVKRPHLGAPESMHTHTTYTIELKGGQQTVPVPHKNGTTYAERTLNSS